MSEVPFFSQRLNEQNFADEGFPSLEEALSWSDRLCGLACLKMTAARFTDSIPSLYSLLRLGLHHGAYKDGSGWVHRGLADLARILGMQAQCTSIGADLDALDSYIRDGAITIVSVSGGFDEATRGGHLVVAFDSDSEAIKVHHPSSWEAYEWPNLWVPRNKFRRCMSSRGNIIVVSPVVS